MATTANFPSLNDQLIFFAAFRRLENIQNLGQKMSDSPELMLSISNLVQICKSAIDEIHVAFINNQPSASNFQESSFVSAGSANSEVLKRKSPGFDAKTLQILSDKCHSEISDVLKKLPDAEVEIPTDQIDDCVYSPTSDLAYWNLLSSFGVGDPVVISQNVPTEKESYFLFDRCRELTSECCLATASLHDISKYNREDLPYEDVDGTTSTRGGFGQVYQVRKRQSSTLFAVKRINGAYAVDDIEQIFNEVRMLKKCTHPNIIRLVEAFQIDDIPYSFHLVLEPWAPYTVGLFIAQSDSERKKACPWFTRGTITTEKTMFQSFCDMADGISYLHENSFKHKDINPANILLHDLGNGSVRAIISDLGLSKVFEAGGMTQSRDATQAYIAPEKKRHLSELKSDVWQLGCVFAFMLAVLQTGTKGYLQLWNSFHSMDGERSAIIADEMDFFLPKFDQICGKGSETQRRAHLITTNMLNLDHTKRWGIEKVKTELLDLLSSPVYM